MITAFLSSITNRVFLILLALTIGFSTVQSIRASHWKAKAESLQITLDNVKVAQNLAAQQALAAKNTAELNYRNLAQKVDTDEQKIRHDAMASAERYIAAHRVRPQAPDRPAGTTAAAPEDHGAASSNGYSPAPLMDEVTVAADDVRICTENTTRLEAARTWAIGLTGEK